MTLTYHLREMSAPATTSWLPEYRSRSGLLLLLVLLVVILPYLPVLGFDFVYDDHLAIEENPYLTIWPGLGRIFFTDLWSLSGLSQHSNYYRPMFLLAYEGIFRFAGAAPWAFHLANLILHGAVTIIVFLLSQRLWKDNFFAALAAVLFSLHPVHVEPVAWIAALSELAFVFCILLGVYFYVDEKISSWALPISVTCFAVALLFKESAVAFFPIIVAYDLLVLKTVRTTRWMLLLGLMVAYLGLRAFALGGLAPAVLYPDLSIPTQVLTALFNIGFYLQKLVIPTDLSAFYDPKFFDTVTPRILFVLLIAGVSVWKLRGKVLWAATWIVAGLLPVLLVSRVAVPLADRDLLLPSVAFAWLLAGALSKLQPRFSLLIAACLAVCYLGLTLQRLPDWRNDFTLFEKELERDPGNDTVRLRLASELARRGDNEAALREIDTVLSEDSNHLEALTNKIGVLVSVRDWEGVQATCDAVLSIEPSAPRCVLALGFIDEENGRLREASESFTHAFQADPSLSQALLHLGVVQARLGNLDQAESTLEQLISRAPSAPAFNNLGTVYAQRGELRKAVVAFQAAVNLNPEFELARSNLQRAIADSQ